MTAYWAVLSARFRMLLQYRAAALAGVVTQTFFGLIRIMIFDAFYRSAAGPHPMTFAQVVSYVWLGQATIRMVILYPDGDVRAMVRSGSVAFEMVRPVDLYGFWYSRAVASVAAPTLLRVVPVLVLAGLFFGLQPPASAASGVAFAAGLLAAVALAAAIQTLLTITLLWTVSGEGVAILVQAGTWLFSGIMVPLLLFPDGFQRFLDVLPFRGLMDLPFRLYIGNIPPSEAAPAIAIPLAWTAGLVLVGKLALARGVRRLVVQGG